MAEWSQHTGTQFESSANPTLASRIALANSRMRILTYLADPSTHALLEPLVERSPQSTMPDNWLNPLTETDVDHLVAFLQTLRSGP